MRAIRAVLLGAGLVLGGVGVRYMIESGLDNIVAAVWWLAGGVIAHDGLLAPATIVLGVISARYLPAWLRVPATVGFVVLGTATVAAVPMLGRFGARPDNATLLDRNYVGGWFVLFGIVVAGVALAAVRRRPSPSAVASSPDDAAPPAEDVS